MREHPDVGMAGSRMEGPDGIPQNSAFRFPSILGEVEGGLRLGIASLFLSRWCCAAPHPAGPLPVRTWLPSQHADLLLLLSQPSA